MKVNWSQLEGVRSYGVHKLGVDAHTHKTHTQTWTLGQTDAENNKRPKLVLGKNISIYIKVIK